MSGGLSLRSGEEWRVSIINTAMRPGPDSLQPGATPYFDSEETTSSQETDVGERRVNMQLIMVTQ